MMVKLKFLGLISILLVVRTPDVFCGALRPPSPMAWAANPFEVHLAFCQAVDQRSVQVLTNTLIEFYEPPLFIHSNSTTQLTPTPKSDPGINTRGELHIVSAKTTADNHTIILTTDPHPLLVDYTLNWPHIKDEPQGGPLFHQVVYNLHGVEATWKRQALSAILWSGWLPDLDLDRCRSVLSPSTEHLPLFKFLARPGYLTLRTLLYPGSFSGDLQLISNQPFQAKWNDQMIQASEKSKDSFVVPLKIEAKDELYPLTVLLSASTEQTRLQLQTVTTNTTDSARGPAPVQLLVPWAPPLPSTPSPRVAAPALTGGSFQVGKDLFTGNQLKCSGCHRIRGEGGQICPDLSNQYQRSADAVLNDIADPSAWLNPNFVSFNLTLRDGLELSGFVHTLNDYELQVIESDGKATVVKRSELQEFRASAVSMMPTGLLDTLTQDQIRDLLTFILAKP